MRLGIGTAIMGAMVLANAMLPAFPALAQQSSWVCFIEGGKREPAHFEPNGNVYVGRHASTEGLAFNEAIENCERSEGNRNACQGSMTPGAICREMDSQRAASYQPMFRRPMNIRPGDYQCETRGTTPIGFGLGWDGQFHSSSNADYQAARRAIESRCTSATCEPMRCFQRSGAQQQAQTNTGGGGGGGNAQGGNFPPGNAQYYWRQVGGNWRGQTVQIDVQACDFRSSHACDSGSVRRYGAGQTQMFHLNGCSAPPIQVQCVVEARNAGPTNPTTPNSNPQAQYERFCRDYADHAVNVTNRASQARCASSGWFSANRTGHYNWCMGAPEATVSAHRQSRQQALDSCLSGTSPGGAGGGLPTGRYQPGERLIRNVGGWDLREHVRPDGTFERCTITFERYAPTNVPRFALFDNNRFILSLTAHESLPAGSRVPTRYSVNGKSFDGVLEVHPHRRSSMDVTARINDFATPSDARIPVRDRTYAFFMYGMPQAMNALRECRARFR